MKKNGKKTKWISNLLFISLGVFSADLSFAIAPTTVPLPAKNTLPGSIHPGVIGNILSATPQHPANTHPAAINASVHQPNTLGTQAAQIKFLLKQVIINGNHVYSNSELTAIVKNKLHTEISVAELQNLVQDLTNFYRNNGYILSRAILPPQHVKNGIVRIRIIEGYIDHVNVIGLPKGARKIMEKYGEKIAQSRPLQIKVMEHYLRLANEVPGMQVKAVLEPSKVQVGASDLNLSAKESTFAGSLSYDNYGTRYIGPKQGTVNASANSIFLAGDSTRVSYATTTRPKQLKFYDISYQSYLGSNGLTGTLGKNNSKTVPGMNLALININGDSTSYYGTLSYPLLRTRDQNLTLDGGFNYLDSQVTSFNFPLYTDHVRSIKAGANYDFTDRFYGSNLMGIHVEKGLNVLGASNSPNSFTTSRFGATGVFTKTTAQAMRLQPIYSHFSAYGLITGQYSFNPLLSSEQFAVGGSQLGRGYDPAEIIGDKGIAGTLELRMDMAPGWAILQTLQPYIFYDTGVLWNLKHVVGIESKQSVASTGLGSRFVFTQNLTGNLMFTQPLTKTVSAQSLLSEGKTPRVFFSLVASI